MPCQPCRRSRRPFAERRVVAQAFECRSAFIWRDEEAHARSRGRRRPRRRGKTRAPVRGPGTTRAGDGAGFRDRRSRRGVEPSRRVSAHSIGHAVRRHLRATRQSAQPSRQDGVVRRNLTRHADFCWRDLLLAPPSSGRPMTVSASLPGVASASLGPDKYAYADSVSLVRVEARAEAVPRWFTTLDTAGREVHHSWPDVLPDSEGVLITVAFRGRKPL